MYDDEENITATMKYDETEILSDLNDDYLYFYYSNHHLKDQREKIDGDIVKPRDLKEGGAFIRMFHKYLECEKEKEENEVETEMEKMYDDEENITATMKYDETEILSDLNNDHIYFCYGCR
ncbi:hypothetical protein T11_18250 [Trichinella zimbabwensis]|uniref:Uncharacterized protein n=1 Tax=Trichinella zimbabwensis TaxID=268475 RepID=A0A0V1GJ84_9BILA|nr:hypothetical protein T11_18250 [Trichinella zimbabwensis]